MSSKKTSVKKEKKKSSKSKLTGKKRNRSKKSKNLIFEVSKNSQNEKEYFIYKDNNKEIINNIKISFVSPSFSKKSKIIYNFSCKEFTDNNNNSIEVIKASILKIENDKNIIFLLLSDKLLLYDLDSNNKYKYLSEYIFKEISDVLTFYIIEKDNELYITFISKLKKLLCKFDSKDYQFNIKYIHTEKDAQQINFLNNCIHLSTLYINTNKIILYNQSNIYYYNPFWNKVRKLNFIKFPIESVTLLRDRILAICSPFHLDLYDVYKEDFVGDMPTRLKEQNILLLKPENNLFLLYNNNQVSLYDFDSLQFLQRLNLGNNFNIEIGNIKQLTNRNLAILMKNFKIGIYNFEKDCIISLFKSNDKSGWIDKIIIELSNDTILFKNSLSSLVIYNYVQGKIIGSIKDQGFINVCKKINVISYKGGKLDNKNEDDKKLVLISSNKRSLILNE